MPCLSIWITDRIEAKILGKIQEEDHEGATCIKSKEGVPMRKLKHRPEYEKIFHHVDMLSTNPWLEKKMKIKEKKN